MSRPDVVHELPTTLAELSRMVGEDTEVARLRFEPLSTAEPRWKPGPDRWSVGECLEHLVIADERYLEMFEPMLVGSRSDGEADGGRTGARPTTLRGTRFGRWFVRQVGPTVPRRFKAPRTFRPGSSETDPGIVQRFLDHRARLSTVLNSADAHDLEALSITSPVTRLLRFKVSDALRLVVLHDRRHVLQACRVLDHEAHPANDGRPGS